MQNHLEAIAKALRAYKTDMESDDTLFEDIEVVDDEVLVLVDGEPVAIKVEIL